MKDALLHTPEGVRDIYGDEIIERKDITEKILGEFHSYGFTDIQTPSFEFFDIFEVFKRCIFYEKNQNAEQFSRDFRRSL